MTYDMFSMPTFDPVKTDILVLGSGVAGLTLAKKLAESGKDVYVLGSPYDSQIAKAGYIEDSEKIDADTKGMKWIETKLEEAKQSGVKHRSSKAILVEDKGENLLIKTKMVDFYANILIVATGSKQQNFGFKGETEYLHKGVSDCAVCDVNLFKGRKAAIIGNHKYTLKSARFISGVVGELSVLWIGEEVPQIDHFEALKNNDSVKFYKKVENVEIYGSDVVEGIKFDSVEGRQDLQIDVVFIEGEPQPNTDIVKGLVEMDENGHIITNSYQTSHPAIFAIGDVIPGEKTLDRALDDAEKLADILIKL